MTNDPGFWLEGCGADFGGCGAKGERGSRLGLSVFSGTHPEWARQAGRLKEVGKETEGRRPIVTGTATGREGGVRRRRRFRPVRRGLSPRPCREGGRLEEAKTRETAKTEATR